MSQRAWRRGRLDPSKLLLRCRATWSRVDINSAANKPFGQSQSSVRKGLAEITCSQSRRKLRNKKAVRGHVLSVVWAAGDADPGRRQGARGSCAAPTGSRFTPICAAWAMTVREAQDLTQAFFAHLLARNPFTTLSPAKGVFRSFLLKSIQHFLADQNDWRNSAAKRGGGYRRFLGRNQRGGAALRGRTRQTVRAGSDLRPSLGGDSQSRLRRAAGRFHGWRQGRNLSS